jgi:hypothetical protein
MKQKKKRNSLTATFKRLLRGNPFHGKLRRSKKGVSSTFIALYLVLITMLLMSALFVGQVISRSSLTDYLKIEQDRRQENILITKLVTDENNVLFVQVNNTGAITVRIRALYVGGEFKLDPSTLAGDSYIEPKEALNITLVTLVPPLPLDSLDLIWTVTTERGIRSSDLGWNLWEETTGPTYTPNKFYFGPLMLLFDMFHWRSGTGPWKSGWSIPKSATEVTWRILLSNVDGRPITITDPSCFTLVGNEQQQNKIVSWFVDPELGSMTFLPGRYYFVYYTWTQPYNDPGTPQIQKPNALTVGIPCINFLTFTGFFTELNGTQTSFGQTIPFEAVLITDETMVESVQVSASLQNIRNNGSATSTITAIVTDGNGNPMANRWVDLYSTAGTLSASHVQTSATGSVIVTLTSSTRKEVATVYATCEGVTGTCAVAFTPAAKIAVTASPATISRNGNSTITVKLYDPTDVAVAQQGIAVTVSQEWSGNKPNTPILYYQTQSSTVAVIVTTDSKGEATIILSGQKGVGSSTLTASSSGLSDGSVVVVLT